MKSSHIIKFLDEVKFGDLSIKRTAEITEHIANCSECRQAFQTAQIAALLLKENAELPTPVPSAYFQTKILNAWREKQAIQKPIAVFWRWWQASATLVVLMLLTVIGLMTATFINPHSGTAADQMKNSNVTLYSTETVILNEKPLKNMTTEQVYEVLDEK